MAAIDEFTLFSQSVLQALERGEMVALATVVQVRGSAPRHAGARMLVWPDGHIMGTVGGGTLEERVMQHAQEALQARRGRLERYLFSTDGNPESVGLCGGEVMVHIEALEPAPTLVVIGAGYVALALAQGASLAGMRLVVVDDRAEFLAPERWPTAAERIHVAYDRETEHLESMPISLTPSTYVLAATWGWDVPALAQVLGADSMPAYMGLIASKTKWRVMREALLAKGISAERLNHVHAPAGLDLGAETQGEIALSVLAEMLAVRRQATAMPMVTLPSQHAFQTASEAKEAQPRYATATEA